MDDAAFSFGIEEEFFLIDPRTRQPMRCVSPQFVQACRSRVGPGVTYELQQSQVEVASPVYASGEQALEHTLRLREGLARVARGMGMGLVAAGSHPMAVWRRLKVTDKSRYERIVRDFQLIARRDVMCGMHVHVAVDGDRIDVMNRLAGWLPLLLALSTSSPFWNRQRTGLMSYRQVLQDEWPRMGIPDYFEDEADYGLYVDRLARCGAIQDARDIWWVIRPAVRFPTLELRIADACTHAGDAVALATLFRCLVRAHVRRPALGAVRTNATRRLIEENRWRAIRYGLRAEFIDESADACVGARQQLEQALETVDDDMRALGEQGLERDLRRLVARGTSADGQLAVYANARERGRTHAEALVSVVDWLQQATCPGAHAHRAEAALRQGAGGSP